MSDITEEIKQRVKERAGHNECARAMDRLQEEIEKGRQWNQLLELELTNLRAILDGSAADWREDAKGWEAAHETEV